MANITRDLLNAPLPEMVKTLGVGIAQAQRALDRVSMELAKELVDTKVEMGDEEYSLLALGFTPTFYQYVDTILEIKMSVSMSKTTEFGVATSVSGGVNVGFVAVSASVSASFSQKYQYSAEGSSMVRTKLVAIPNPPAFEQRLKAMIATELEDKRNQLTSIS
ncbi:hypothetical protein [Tenacibaculum maritimum]|uniref:hypothetical protein n=1 Tax=Tenacibaculum maritimum TaxID=107401 RepID=UPI0004058697|nr:hypothetical protein [Tenacibaculum maritimum]MCD9563528.1 hypothetical protein [Tenacibaculum maritimum]MCD9565515.1 hypothetical protein [Tenacibaculum maritimum]MCD9579138.1 hypothetical protein [Tenacibaculum maritimum]MCD9580911.1 hypothetical protein [Tenacibaculum maritimum]MCD9583763.1 hypothetical protein [Tenacibaculum maritimum]